MNYILHIVSNVATCIFFVVSLFVFICSTYTIAKEMKENVRDNNIEDYHQNRFILIVCIINWICGFISFISIINRGLF